MKNIIGNGEKKEKCQKNITLHDRVWILR